MILQTSETNDLIDSKIEAEYMRKNGKFYEQ